MRTDCVVCGKKLAKSDLGNASCYGDCQEIVMEYLFELLTSMSSAELNDRLGSLTVDEDSEIARLTNGVIDAAVKEEASKMSIPGNGFH